MPFLLSVKRIPSYQVAAVVSYSAIQTGGLANRTSAHARHAPLASNPHRKRPQLFADATYFTIIKVDQSSGKYREDTRKNLTILPNRNTSLSVVVECHVTNGLSTREGGGKPGRSHSLRDAQTTLFRNVHDCYTLLLILRKKSARRQARRYRSVRRTVTTLTPTGAWRRDSSWRSLRAVPARSRVNPRLVSLHFRCTYEPSWSCLRHRSFRPPISLTTLRRGERSYVHQ